MASTAPERTVPAPLFDVTDLRITIPSAHADVALVDGIDIAIGTGECVALVGESGCGKSLTGLASIGLLPSGAIAEGEVRWDGRPVSGDLKARKALLGSEISMVYQDALTSLNPAMTVGAQLRQVLGRRRRRQVSAMLEMVSLPDPERVAGSFPFQLSGGQRQRVLLAIALAREPRLLIADEPTTALDETVQAQVIELIERLQETRDFALLLITHNLALVARIATRVIVMYAGQVVEEGPTSQLIGSPHHPYTQALVECIRSLEREEHPVPTIPGTVPAPSAFPPGCRFSSRCPRATAECDESPPPLESVVAGERVACYHPIGVVEGT